MGWLEREGGFSQHWGFSVKRPRKIWPHRADRVAQHLVRTGRGLHSIVSMVSLLTPSRQPLLVGLSSLAQSAIDILRNLVSRPIWSNLVDSMSPEPRRFDIHQGFQLLGYRTSTSSSDFSAAIRAELGMVLML